MQRNTDNRARNCESPVGVALVERMYWYDIARILKVEDPWYIHVDEACFDDSGGRARALQIDM